MNPTLKRATRELEAEMQKQCRIIYPAVAIVLWNDYGWRRTKILRRFTTSQQVWTECANHGTAKSMMQMLEDETGVEIRLADFDKSFHDLAYLDAAKWDGHQPTSAEAVYIRKRQIKWIAPQIVACVCISLHRDDGFGADRIADFIGKVDRLRNEYAQDPAVYRRLLTERTELKPEDLTC